MSNNKMANLQSPVNVDSLLIIVSSVRQDGNQMDKLYAPCIGSKFTQIMRQNKTMILTIKKFEKVHADLWGLHHPPSQSESVYAAIFIQEHTWKTWTLYLRNKDNFVDIFQTWLPHVKAESECLIKIFRANSDREFLSIKFWSFYEKRDIMIQYAAPCVHKENWLV